jgi:aldose 1-epimerase
MKIALEGFFLSLLALFVIHCGADTPEPQESGTAMEFQETDFGQTRDGQRIHLYTCRNSSGMTLKLTNYGAIVVSVEVPDKMGNIENVTLGFPNLEGYVEHNPFFGATVGRFCNRIGGASFELDGRVYNLAANDGRNHLHGGRVGFDKVVWDAEPIQEDQSAGVRFTYLSPGGDEGYPGNLNVSATYLLTEDNELQIEFDATTDQATPVNLTNHAYWNLAGKGSILDHMMQIEADQYLVVDRELIPTGEIAEVAGTPLDFRTPHSIGSRIEDLKPMIGYDHCYVLRSGAEEMPLAARVAEPSSGRVMEVYTTQPGMQFYSGNFLNGSESMGGYDRYEGFCLETQHFPDSPNKPDFPSTILRPNEKYHEVTIYKFSSE